MLAVDKEYETEHCPELTWEDEGGCTQYVDMKISGRVNE